MQAATSEQVPLTADEKDFLLTVYDTRWRRYLWVYIFLFVLALVYAMRIDTRGRYSGEISRWEDNNPDAKYVSRFGMQMINFIFLEGMFMSTGIFFWVKRVRPLKKDADLGMKEKIPFTIVQKQYYNVSGQYFFAIDDPKLLRTEVDEETYNKMNEGDTCYIYRGVYSKFIFEENGRYTLM